MNNTHIATLRHMPAWSSSCFTFQSFSTFELFPFSNFAAARFLLLSFQIFSNDQFLRCQNSYLVRQRIWFHCKACVTSFPGIPSPLFSPPSVPLPLQHFPTYQPCDRRGQRLASSLLCDGQFVELSPENLLSSGNRISEQSMQNV